MSHNIIHLAIVLYTNLHYRSYTTFKYSSLSITPSAIRVGQNVYVEVSVENIGNWPSDEVT